MPDLRDQLRTYLDETSDPVTPDDVYERPIGSANVRPLSRMPAPSRIPTGVLVAVAAGVAVLLVVALPLLTNRGGGDAPADEGAVTSTVAPTTTTPIVVESTPTTIQQLTVDVTSSIVPGLGTLTWMRIDGDETSLPQTISEFEDGQFVAYDAGGRWTSPDAVTWTLDDSAPFGDYRWFHEVDGWAIGSTGADSQLLRRDGDGWIPVAFPPAPVPGVTGLTWNEFPAIPMESDGVILAPVWTHGQVDWGDAYGMFEVDCGQVDPCVVQPYSLWDTNDESLQITNPGNGETLARVDIVPDGETIRFVDEETGDVVHEVTGTAGYPAERIVDQLRGNGSGLSDPGGFVSTDGGDTWAHVEFPWRIDAEVMVLPDGGFGAFGFDYRWENESKPLAAANVWTSADGRTWSDRGEPGFTWAAAQSVNVRTLDDRLLATVVTGYDDSTGLPQTVTYVSTNGIAWAVADVPFPSWFDENEASYGIVVSSMPQSRYEFWVSTDGGTVWHEVEGPPGSHEPTWAGGAYSAGGAVGDIMYVSFGVDPAGERTLWIGRFVP